MNHLKNMAMKIPDRIRSERIMTEQDPIANAQPNELDKQMQLLAKIWFAYIEPHKEPTSCPICLSNILSSFRNLKPALIELETTYQKLNYL